MVWVGGSQGTLAPCLVELFLEADRRWPNRSRASDGSLGDAAHASRDSDHNPKSPNPPGWVDAGDLTDDKASGCDADLLAHHLVASRDPRVKYVIWNGTVVRSYDRPATSTRPFLRAWTPEPYTGSNPHDKHTHISVTPEGRADTSPWFPVEQEDPFMAALTPEEQAELLNLTRENAANTRTLVWPQDTPKEAQHRLYDLALWTLAEVKASQDPEAFAARIAAHLDGITAEDVTEAVKRALREGSG